MQFYFSQTIVMVMLLAADVNIRHHR